jgi:hypothetical protein
MLLHASIPALSPARVADFIAELWGSRALPFPPVPGACIVFANDPAGTCVEVYPAGTTLIPGAVDVTVGRAPVRGSTESHVALTTRLDEATVHVLAGARSWISRTCRRGGPLPGQGFTVIEVWPEGVAMIEVLTATMQDDYRLLMRTDGWLSLLAAGAPGGTQTGTPRPPVGASVTARSTPQRAPTR